jgi:hypothetical protein
VQVDDPDILWSNATSLTHVVVYDMPLLSEAFAHLRCCPDLKGLRFAQTVPPSGGGPSAQVWACRKPLARNTNTALIAPHWYVAWPPSACVAPPHLQTDSNGCMQIRAPKDMSLLFTPAPTCRYKTSST